MLPGMAPPKYRPQLLANYKLPTVRGVLDPARTGGPRAGLERELGGIWGRRTGFPTMPRCRLWVRGYPGAGTELAPGQLDSWVAGQP